MKDSLTSVQVLIKKVNKLIKSTKGEIKKGWEAFLQDCICFFDKNYNRKLVKVINVSNTAWVNIKALFYGYEVSFHYNNGNDLSIRKTYSTLNSATKQAFKIKKEY